MGNNKIHYRKEFKFRERSIILTAHEGQGDLFGYEVHLEEEITEIHGLGSWSFGHKEWSKEVWEKWGQYVEHQLDLCNGDSNKLQILIDSLLTVDCEFLEYRGGTIYPEKVHLRDLNIILKLTSMTEFIPLRSSMKRTMTESEMEYYLWLKDYDLKGTSEIVDSTLTFEYAIQEGYHPYQSTETGNYIFIQGKLI